MSGGTGRVGLTIVGQVIGAYFPPFGSVIGGAIGSYIGGELWPEQLEGPKLEGLQVTSSAYGGPIPDIYGAVRIGGNIIWASAIRETASTEREGKGGGPEITKYAYSVDVAVSLGAGPITGIRSIWADQKLIFDLGETDIGTIQASYLRGGRGMRFYTGSTTQLPDPTIEATLGVGNTPAFRDVAYIMFVDFQLADYGNRFPNISVEVVSAPATLGPRRLFGEDVEEIVTIPAEYPNGYHHRIASVDGELILINEGLSRKSYIMTPVATGASVVSYAVLPERWPPGFEIFEETGTSLLFWPLPNSSEEEEDGGDPIYTFQMAPTNTTPNLALQDFRSSSHDFTATLTDGGNFVQAIVPCVDREHVFAFCQVALGVGAPFYWVLWKYDNENHSFDEIRRGTCDASISVERAGGAMRSRDSGVQIFYAGMMESDLEHVWITTSALGQVTRCYEISAAGVLSVLAALNFGLPDPGGFGTINIYADGACAWVESQGNIYGFTRAPAMSSTVLLSDVVSAICQQCSLTAGDIDVTDLASKTVRGYIRTPRMSGRAAIEPLMTAYAFGAVESDLKIKFRLHNATSVVTFASDDIGAAESIDESIALVDTERTQESELPQSIDLSYMAPRADYQIGTQLIKRIATESVDKQSIRFALALEDSEAATIAARMLYEIWIARNQRKWSSTVKYAKYEPTDVVSVVAESATYKVRVIDKRERGNLIEWTGLDVDAAAFNPTATAQEVEETTQIVTVPKLTNPFAADLPPLREADFGRTGYYGGASGFQAGWPGAAIFRKPAGGTEYQAELNVLTAATMGGTVTALAGWGTLVDGGYAFNGYYPDLVNYIDINMTSSSTPASVTHAQFMNLEQIAVIGNEIIAYRDAVLVSGNVYRLSCLLRGLLGTEWYASLPPATYDDLSHPIETVDGHRSGDRFVRLSTSTIQRYSSGSTIASIGGSIKGVTFGATLALAGIKPLPQTWASIVHPHPVQLQGYKSGSTSLTIDFDPRTFVGGTWDSSREVTLDPTHLEYAVHIRNPVTPTINYDFIVTGTPPFVINSAEITTVLNGGVNLWVLVAATPKAYPGTGSLAILGDPASSHRHWSRQLAVSWA